jgi:hypothetical protein
VILVDERIADYTAHQRAAAVKDWLDAGERLTVAQIAHRLGMSYNGAKRIVVALSGMGPYLVIDHLWQRLRAE